jgi:hypothetical protein
MLGYQIVYLRAEGQEFYNCASIATLLLDVLYPVYSFLQLFFIFKYSNVSVHIGFHISHISKYSNMITIYVYFLNLHRITGQRIVLTCTFWKTSLMFI